MGLGLWGFSAYIAALANCMEATTTATAVCPDIQVGLVKWTFFIESNVVSM
jgi:hypothetical protein